MAWFKQDKGEENPIFEEKDERKDNPRQTGVIHYLSSDGWGHITSKDIPFTKIFFHWTALNNNKEGYFLTLDKGMKVEFDYFPDFQGQGPRAVKIEVLE